MFLSDEPECAEDYRDYNPPINDEQDLLLDGVLEELQDMVREERYYELADDFVETLDIHDDEVLQTDEDNAETAITSDDSDEPLHPGSRRKLGVVYLLLTVFMIRFRLADETMKYLLTMITLLLPDGNKMIRSLYHLRKYLGSCISLPSVTYYCAFCFTLVDKDDAKCKNPICAKDLTVTGALAYFVRHNILTQLQVFFRRQTFTEAVRSHRFKHLHNSNGNLCDVYDGELYKKLFENHFLDNPNNISFALNTDGVSIFKSSRISMWPVYMLINELPIKDRKARENTLFYGIWIAEKKPVMWTFLLPLYEEISILESGVTLTDHTGQDFMCKATLLTCTCDLPAKSLLTNSNQFNGMFGCWCCLQPGENYRTEAGGNVHVFPYQEGDPRGPPRTNENVTSDVNKVVENIANNVRNYLVHGIKGPSRLMMLHHFDFVRGFVIDYMHGVCGGVMKLLLNLWFGKDNKSKMFSYFRSKDRVSSFLKQIKPTLFITRIPRSLDDVVYWKSSEYKNFLLYWGIPVLCDVLKSEHFAHFTLFVQAIYLLSKDCITPTDLLDAERYLDMFVMNFPKLYDLRYLTLNVHQLLHLTTNVKWCGPLFANNCFIFEDLNGFIVQHIHGTQGVASQVINTVNLLQAIPILQQKFGNTDLEALAFIDSIKGVTHKNWQEIIEGWFYIGSSKAIEFCPLDLAALRIKYPLIETSGTCWLKLYIKQSNSYVYCSEYKRMVRRNQSCIKYTYGNSFGFGSVKFFAQVSDQFETHNVALVIPFELNYVSSNHIHKVDPLINECIVVPLKEIVCSCLFVQKESNHFVCEIPNKYDRD